ncbi:MAG: guanylate kinase [Chlamydiales bacterium]
MSKKVLGNKKRGQLFVVSAPAGTGKSTLVEMLLTEFPRVVAQSCSSTTRAPRPDEVKDVHYEFLSKEEFLRRLANGEFLEHAEVFGHFYGTRTSEVVRLQEEGKHVVLVIDTQGAMQVKKKVEATFIFISPPSFGELRSRLLKRRTEDDAMIDRRLDWAKREVEMAPHYDYQIVNDDLKVTYQVLRSIFIAQEHKK